MSSYYQISQNDAAPVSQNGQLHWENAACEITDGEVSSRLPEGATVFYFNVRDEDLNLVSSVFVELESGKDKR